MCDNDDDNDEMERLGGQQSSPNPGIISAFSWRDCEKSRKSSVKITGVPADIRTDSIQNTIKERHV
jgi:hypothetical protein